MSTVTSWKIDVDSINVTAYQMKKIKKETKIRKASPPILLITIHHTIMPATRIFHMSTKVERPTVFFTIANTTISVISNV